MTPQETARAILAWYGGDARKWRNDGAMIDAGGFLIGNAKRRSLHCACVANVGIHVTRQRAHFEAFLEAATRITETDELADWNDAPERTFADVVALLERIAAEPEEKS